MSQAKSKICSKCKKEFPLTSDHWSPNEYCKDGVHSWCRYCQSAYSRKYREKNPEWKKMDNKRNAILINELVREWQKSNPEAMKAIRIIAKAIKQGKIIRGPCVINNKICSKGKAHGHHEDYKKPLEVDWLCAKHHKRLHANILTKEELIKLTRSRSVLKIK